MIWVSWGTWVAQLSLQLYSGHDLTACEFSGLKSVLSAQTQLRILCPPVSLLLPLLCLSLSLKNKHLLKNDMGQSWKYNVGVPGWLNQ